MELQAVRQAFCMLNKFATDFKEVGSHHAKEFHRTELTSTAINGRLSFDFNGSWNRCRRGTFKEKKLVHLGFLYIIKEVFHYSPIWMPACCTMSFMINNGWIVSKWKFWLLLAIWLKCNEAWCARFLRYHLCVPRMILLHHMQLFYMGWVWKGRIHWRTSTLLLGNIFIIQRCQCNMFSKKTWHWL